MLGSGLCFHIHRFHFSNLLRSCVINGMDSDVMDPMAVQAHSTLKHAVLFCEWFKS